MPLVCTSPARTSGLTPSVLTTPEWAAASRERRPVRLGHSSCAGATFRRIPRNGKSYFTMMSLHINNQYAKKRGIAENLLLAVRTVMHQERVDMVAVTSMMPHGDFRSGNEQRRDSTFEEAFANTNLPIPQGPTTLWGPGVPAEWADVCGFIKPPSSESEWHIRMHGAFEIPHEIL